MVIVAALDFCDEKSIIRMAIVAAPNFCDCNIIIVT